jgi:hypothetical protein
MIKISSVSPLIFDIESTGFEHSIDYVQKFEREDIPILIQIVDVPNKTFTMLLVDLYNGTPYQISPQKYEINDYNTLYEFTINPSNNGTYQVRITNDQGEISVSLPFCVHSSSYTPFTMQIEYTNADNQQAFGAVFDISGNKRVFKTRVEGGFKSDSRQLAVESEQFRTQKQEPINLYSVPYEKRTLTIGDNEGVPFEMARLLNNIFCLSSVKIDGVSYTRSESSVPEQQVIAERYPQFNYTLTVECSENVSYNGFTEYPDGSGIVGEVSLNVSNAKDGQVLVFDGNEGSFVNQSHLDSL